MESVLYAGLVALGVFAIFASCAAIARVPVVHGRIYHRTHGAARRR